MKKRLKRIIKQIIYSLMPGSLKIIEGNGERVHINLKKKVDYEKFDIYQKSHFRRYEFAKQTLTSNEICGDFACGTGYGSIMLSEKAQRVIGIDINSIVIEKITHRYKKNKKVEFIASDLLNLRFSDQFDAIVSFETIEHFTEGNIQNLFNIFSRALKKNGKLIFSTPYLQQETKEAIAMGHHLTYNIDESKIETWLTTAGFTITTFKYQNYISHSIEDSLEQKDFIICAARKA